MLEQARDNMLMQQLRPFGVLDQKVLDLFAVIPRENFMPKGFTELAYADAVIPLGHGQAMLSPKETGRMLQAVNINSNDNILIVGAESGYIAAFTAKMAKHVTVVDTDQTLLLEAKQKLRQLSINNVTFSEGDAAAGWEKDSPFHVIIITGSIPYLPQGFRKNLARNGRIFAIIGHPPVMQATVVKRGAQQQWTSEHIFNTDHPRLPNARIAEEFKL